MLRHSLLTLVLIASALIGPPSMARSDDHVLPDSVTVPVRVQGAARDMTIQFHKPQGAGPFPVVIHLHGRGINREQRAAMTFAAPPSHVEWWLRQGVAVVAPVRVGYGATGGPDVEDTGARWEGSQCTGEPEFTKVAWAASESAAAAHRWVMQQPWARKDRIVVEGYSFGGLAATSVAGLRLEGVKGIINFSGGTAGNPVDAPGRSCRPDLMARAYGVLGQQSRVPSLWLYAENDPYWGPDAPRTWHAAFRQAGGNASFVQTPPIEGGDGHELMIRGTHQWAGSVEAFLRRIGFAAG